MKSVHFNLFGLFLAAVLLIGALGVAPVMRAQTAPPSDDAVGPQSAGQQTPDVDAQPQAAPNNSGNAATANETGNAATGNSATAGGNAAASAEDATAPAPNDAAPASGSAAQSGETPSDAQTKQAVDNARKAAAVAPGASTPAGHLRPGVPEALFYSVPGNSSVKSFREHAQRVGVIAPQAFALDSQGRLHGSLPLQLSDIARESDVDVMPVVVNAGFSRSAGSALLHDDTARDRAVGELVSATESLGIIGWQLDFEGLHSSDRDVLSAFVGELAEALHRRGKMLSVAVAARTSDEPSETFYNFSGVYDYRALALAADFISVMAYPEHDGKHPGPLASYPWVNAVVLHVLDSAPADKVSLGLPTYQTDFSERRTRLVWHRRIRHRLHRFFRIVFLPVAHNGAADHGRKRLQWDPVLKSSYRVYGKGRRHHIIWVEDERSFKAKLEIVEKYHLRGFSVWRIGLEDPHIWTTLPDVERTSVQKSETAPEPALVGRAAGK